jgi:hypothetical protein
MVPTGKRLTEVFGAKRRQRQSDSGNKVREQRKARDEAALVHAHDGASKPEHDTPMRQSRMQMSADSF